VWSDYKFIDGIFNPKEKIKLKKNGAISGCSYGEGQINSRKIKGPELY